MEQIILALREIKQVLTQIAVAQAIIDSLLFFVVLYFAGILLSIDLALVFIIAIIYFIIHCSYKIKNINLASVEDAVPELREQLTTSADNLKMDNEIVQLLHLDVLSRMREVKVSLFIPYKKLWREIMSIAGIAFLIIILASLNVKFFDYKTMLTGFSTKDVKSQQEFQQVAGGENISGGEIFGNESIAELGNRQLELQINPVLSEINLDDIKDAKPKNFDTSDIPKEIVASTDSSFDEKIPREHKEIVKRYFEGISGQR